MGTRKSIISCLVILLFSGSISVAETVSVSAKGIAIVSGNVTLDEAKMTALNRARGIAVERAAGVITKRFSLLSDNLLVADFIKSFVRGFLVEESIVGWHGSWSKVKENLLGQPIVEVTINGKVALLSDSFIRSEAFEATLNRNTFRDGERVHVRITAHNDMYLLLANYTAKGTVVPLFPNDYAENNLVRSGVTLQHPTNKSGHPPFVVTNYPDHNRDTEAVIVIGLPVNNITQNYAWSRVFPPGIEMEYPDYFLKISELPIDWIGEKILVYTVNRK